MIIYEFLYCSCTFESAYATMSLHRTKAGAYKAMKDHKWNTYMEWYENRALYGKRNNRFAYDFGQDWTIGEQKLLD
jgi:hypothetical protein